MTGFSTDQPYDPITVAASAPAHGAQVYDHFRTAPRPDDCDYVRRWTEIKKLEERAKASEADYWRFVHSRPGLLQEMENASDATEAEGLTDTDETEGDEGPEAKKDTEIN